MGKLFGTDGIRGIADEYPITAEMGYKLGRAIIEYCRKKGLIPEIVIGRDTRKSGKRLEQAIVSGILSNGGKAFSAGIIPTPGVAFLVKDLKKGAGVVLSASHNPPEYNGFKVISNEGFKLTEDEEAELEGMLLNESGAPDKGDMTRALMLEDANESYMSFLAESLPEKIKKFKVILDCSNGATYKVAPSLFKKLGLDGETLSTEHDGKNININCGSQHTESLSKRVMEAGACLGLAFDGDGDRLIAVDEKGVTLTGDQVITICAKMLHDRGVLRNNMVVTTVMSNMGLISALKGFGISHAATGVGDRLVMEEMKRLDACIGGEDSGHIIFSDHHTTGDGILTALQLVYAVQYFNKPLSELSSMMTIFPQTLINVPVKIKPEISGVPAIARIIKKVEATLGDEGRIIVRYSGTEPLCRVMVEGKNQEEIERSARLIVEVIKKELNL
jgi:phosphoglucosamine mutase